MDTSFWESLRLGFMQLRAECAINPPTSPAGRLTAIWTAEPIPGRWRLSYWNKKDGAGIATRFTWHAQSGAAMLGFVGDDDASLAFWLDRIRRDAPEQYLNKISSTAGPDGVDELYSIEILDICGLSADYCRKCEADQIRSRAATRPPASERIFTKPQQDRITAAEEELNDTIVAHEQMREFIDSDEWRQHSPLPNGPTMSGETAKLERDINKYAINVLTVLAQASWSLGSLESFRSRLETDARDIIARVRGKANPKDLPLLDQGALEKTLDRAVSEWVLKAERKFPPPWNAGAPTETTTGFPESAGSDSAEPAESSVLDLQGERAPASTKAPSLHAPGTPTGGEKNGPVLNAALIKTWMEGEGWSNETLAERLKISERAVSSMRNNKEYHGSDAVTKLANLMGRDVADLYLP